MSLEHKCNEMKVGNLIVSFVFLTFLAKLFSRRIDKTKSTCGNYNPSPASPFLYEATFLKKIIFEAQNSNKLDYIIAVISDFSVTLTGS